MPSPDESGRFYRCRLWFGFTQNVPLDVLSDFERGEMHATSPVCALSSGAHGDSKRDRLPSVTHRLQIVTNVDLLWIRIKYRAIRLVKIGPISSFN